MSRAIWFIVEHENGEVHRGAAEMATAARSLGGEAVAIACTAPGSDLGERVAPLADRVILLEAPELEPYSGDAWAQAITGLAVERQPDAILLPHAPVGRDLGPMLAARLETGMLSDCIDLDWDEGLVGSRSVYRRKLVARERVAGSGPAVATLQRGAFAAAPAADAGSIESVDASVDADRVRTRLLEVDQAEAGEEDITEADRVVAGGRGLGDAEKFQIVEDLARAIGGVMAASRPVVDQGWAAHERQVGSSGVTVRPQLYIAVGVSGAIQHVVGMRESDVIVAINKDPQAPIFEYAHYGIVDDLFKVVPALLDEIRGD